MIEKEYLEHRIFEKLDGYANFYSSLGLRIMGFIPHGIKGFFNIDTYLYTSIQGTLESMRDILTKGRINDSYALLRKYYDSTIINIYSILYLSDNYSIENFVVEKIDNWVKGKEKLPEYRVMSNYIRTSNKLTKMNELLYKDDRYKAIRDRCNDHTHYNFYRNVLLNDNALYLRNRAKSLDYFSNDLQNILIMHLCYLFYLNDYYMSSDDYIMALESNITPEVNSQYFVAPFIQNIFDSVIKKYRMDLYEEIKSKTCMMLQ